MAYGRFDWISAWPPKKPPTRAAAGPKAAPVKSLPLTPSRGKEARRYAHVLEQAPTAKPAIKNAGNHPGWVSTDQQERGKIRKQADTQQTSMNTAP